MLKKKDILKTAYDTFEIIEQIGEGGNGTVYKVKNSDNLVFAAKVIDKARQSSEKIKRFKNEIHFCETNSNAHIIKVLDRGFFAKDSKEYMFYIMPLCTHSLRDEIKIGILPADAISYFYQLCEGLEYAHNRGCFHKDLKPENILIDETRNCIIADFGIAHFAEDDKKTAVTTKSTDRLANFTYHAPEQEKAGAVINESADIFALGLLLNEMITKEVPKGTKYKKISDIDNKYSFLDDLVTNMIVQDPLNRLRSIQDVVLELQARIKIAEDKNRIEDLQKPIASCEVDDNLFNNPISCKNIDISDGQLVVLLSNTPNYKWIEEYQHALSTFTSSPYCYQHFSFKGNSAIYEINSLLGYSNTEEMFLKMVKEFKEAVNITNQHYQSRLIDEKKYKESELIVLKQKEIERIKSESKLRHSLKSFL